MIEGMQCISSDFESADNVEIPNPRSEGPKIMMSCVGIGMVTGSIFLIVLLFVAGDIDTVINSSAPLLQILIHSTQNRAGAICLLMYAYSSLTS